MAANTLLWSAGSLAGSWMAQELVSDAWSSTTKRTRRLLVLGALTAAAAYRCIQLRRRQTHGEYCQEGWRWILVHKSKVSAVEYETLRASDAVVHDHDSWEHLWVSPHKFEVRQRAQLTDHATGTASGSSGLRALQDGLEASQLTDDHATLASGSSGLRALQDSLEAALEESTDHAEGGLDMGSDEADHLRVRSTICIEEISSDDAS